MSGTDIVGELLRAEPDLVAVVPLARIMAGRLPVDTPAPTILLRTISRVDRTPLKRQPVVRSTDRVGVTVRARDLEQQELLIRLVRRAGAGRTGTIAGYANVEIQTLSLGPDMEGPGESFEQEQDFRVGFDAPA